VPAAAIESEDLRSLIAASVCLMSVITDTLAFRIGSLLSGVVATGCSCNNSCKSNQRYVELCSVELRIALAFRRGVQEVYTGTDLRGLD
jgi:hypothetical protein